MIDKATIKAILLDIFKEFSQAQPSESEEVEVDSEDEMESEEDNEEPRSSIDELMEPEEDEDEAPEFPDMVKGKPRDVKIDILTVSKLGKGKGKSNANACVQDAVKEVVRKIKKGK